MSNLANTTVGIIGGGQLAKMLAQVAIDMGLKLNFWLDAAESIVNQLGTTYQEPTHHFDEFCNQSDVIIFEHEHVDLNYLDCLNHAFQHKCPALGLLLATQNRQIEKELFSALSIPCAKPIELDAPNIDDFPIVLKKRVGGYDGKGQYIVSSLTELKATLSNTSAHLFIAEQFVTFHKECSLVCVRSQQGDFHAYDLTENKNQAGMLAVSQNIINSPLYAQAFQYCQRIAEETRYVGVFAVEFFITSDNQLIANEISPRVHNSGHWTMDGAFVSQFENHIRVSLGIPIGNVKSHSNIQMTNITTLKQLDTVYQLDAREKVYVYGKSPREGRKMGHINKLIL